MSLSLLLGLFGGMGTAAQEASPYYAAEEIPSSTAAALELTTEELTRVKRSDRLYSVDVEAPDGSGRSITLPTPLKYTDDRGEVRWIDTAMEPIGDIYSFYSGYDYRNAANRFTVYYSQWPDAGLDLDGDFRLSAVVPEGAQRLVGYPVDDTLVYPDAFGAFSRLEQSNISEGVSQTVIFTEAPLSHTFAFRLQSSAFRPSLSEDGSSILLEKTDGMPGESYTFSAFVLADQSGAVQGNAAYTLVQAGEGRVGNYSDDGRGDIRWGRCGLSTDGNRVGCRAADDNV